MKKAADEISDSCTDVKTQLKNVPFLIWQIYCKLSKFLNWPDDDGHECIDRSRPVPTSVKCKKCDRGMQTEKLSFFSTSTWSPTWRSPTQFPNVARDLSIWGLKSETIFWPKPEKAYFIMALSASVTAFFFAVLSTSSGHFSRFFAEQKKKECSLTWIWFASASAPSFRDICKTIREWTRTGMGWISLHSDFMWWRLHILKKWCALYFGDDNRDANLSGDRWN